VHSAKIQIHGTEISIYSAKTQICGAKIQIFELKFKQLKICTTKNLPLCIRKTPNPAKLSPTLIGVSVALFY